jgi:hypothetical protein
MKLQSNEKIVKVYHHHKLFFVIRAVKIWMASLPFFLVGYVVSYLTPNWIDMIIYGSIFSLFALIQSYDSLMYYLDTLVITNQRVVHLDWINLFRYLETQAGLDDIQDIESAENGFLSKIKLFDFGLFKIETSSTKTVMIFTEAPDPEEIKFFVVNLSRKHKDLVESENSKHNTDAYTISQNIETPASKVASGN